MTWLHDVREGGYRAGYTDGHAAGFSEGYNAGRDEGVEAGQTMARSHRDDLQRQLRVTEEQLDAARRVAEEFRGNFRRGLCVGVFGGSLAATILASILVRIL